MAKASKLLEGIEQDALNPKADIASALRKCIALGGASGSDQLRDWASRELKGYGPDDEVPNYRNIAAPLLVDGVTLTHQVTNHPISPSVLPIEVRDHIKEEIVVRMPIAEIMRAMDAVHEREESTVKISPPGGSDIVLLMNHRNDDPGQQITRLYWAVSVSGLARVLDVVRTTLVELVTEMRASMSPGAAAPTKEAADQAVSIAIHGNRNRVSLASVSQTNQSLVGETMEVAPESRARRAGWWVFGMCGVLAAIAAAVPLIGVW